MANSTLAILINTDYRNQGLVAAQNGLRGLNTGLVNLSSGINVARQVFQTLEVVTQALIGNTMDYAAQIRDLTRETGMSADEASRLTQVADDLTVSFDTLETAAKNAARQGITLTTDALAAMSDEYLALEPGAERTRYALEKFGKQAGPEMQKFLEKGSGAIKDMSAAIDDSLVLTEAQVQAARDLEMSWDGVKDKAGAVGIEIGNSLIPPLTRAADAALLLITRGETQRDLWVEHEAHMRTAAGSYEEYTAEVLRSAAAAGFNWTQIMLENDGVTDLGTELEYLQKHWGAATELQYANVGANQAWMEAADGARVSLEELGIAIEQNVMEPVDLATASMQDLTAEMLYNKAAAGLDADAALALARGMGLVDEGTYAAMNALNTLRGDLEDGTITVEEYNAKVIALGAAWLLVPDSYSTTYDIEVSVSGDPIPDFGLNDPDAPIPFGEDPEGPINGMLAGGGTAREGLGYWVGEQGPEFFRPRQSGTVYANGETPGGVSVNVYGAVTVREDADIEKIAARLAELVRRRK